MQVRTIHLNEQSHEVYGPFIDSMQLVDIFPFPKSADSACIFVLMNPCIEPKRLVKSCYPPTC